MGRQLKEYALYKGDEFITMGTLKEISKETSKSYDRLLSYNSPSYKKDNNKREYQKTYFLVEVEIE